MSLQCSPTSTVQMLPRIVRPVADPLALYHVTIRPKARVSPRDELCEASGVRIKTE